MLTKGQMKNDASKNCSPLNTLNIYADWQISPECATSFLVKASSTLVSQAQCLDFFILFYFFW
jgi:hypothetical protein